MLNRKYPFWVLTFIGAGILFSLRFNYGNDYKSYEETFYLSEVGLSFWGEKDILFTLLLSFAPSFEIFVAISTSILLISIFFVCRVINSEQRFWFILFYFFNPFIFLTQLSAIRQSLAISFINLAAYAIIRYKNKMAAIFSAIAPLGHISALSVTPVFFSARLINSYSRLRLVSLFSFMIIIGMMLFPLLDSLLFHFDIFVHYKAYLEDAEKGSVLSFLFNLFLLGFLIFHINKVNRSLLFLGCVGLSIKLISINALMLNRIAMYLDVFIVLSISFVLASIKNKTLKLGFASTLLMTYILRYFLFFTNETWSAFHDIKFIFMAPF